MVMLLRVLPGLGQVSTTTATERAPDRVFGLSGVPGPEVKFNMTARIRLLVFWLNFKNVGMGRVSWSDTPGQADAIELLLGSDPLSAPMKINRWGYLAERRVDSRFELIGVMTQADEESVQQARKNLESEGEIHVFKAIRTRVENGAAESITHHIPSTTDFTIRDLEALLTALPTSGGKIRRLSLPPETEPGFLFSVKRLIHESVEILSRSGNVRSAANAHCVYVFNGTLHELTLTSAKLKEKLKIADESYPWVIESEFRTKNLASGNTEKFKITYGTQEPNSGIPLEIVYRPKWWFEAMLQRTPPAAGG